jgi:hypothetical protein
MSGFMLTLGGKGWLTRIEELSLQRTTTEVNTAEKEGL